MGIHRHAFRQEPRQQGPARDWGWTGANSGGPFLYRSPDGTTFRVYGVAFVRGKMFRTDMRPRLSATHRVFVAADGARRFVAFTDIVSRGSSPRTLYEQLASAVAREELPSS